MTREKLEALNKQRALKRGKSEKPIKQSTSKKTKWTTISIWLNALLLIALLMILLYLPIDSGFWVTQTGCLADQSPGTPGKDIGTLKSLLVQPVAGNEPYKWTLPQPCHNLSTTLSQPCHNLAWRNDIARFQMSSKVWQVRMLLHRLLTDLSSMLIFLCLEKKPIDQNKNQEL